LSELSYTLVTDGSFDRVLKYPIEWLLRQWSDCATTGQWENPTIYRSAPNGFPNKIRRAVEDYPCDLLFVHRDAEAQPREVRIREIEQALASIAAPPAVCIVPVRMTEAWLLFDEAILRQAAGNPRGTRDLALPPPQRVESLHDAKETLYRILREASGRRGRRAKTFRPSIAAHRLAELVEDFSPLRQLTSFRALEVDLRNVLQANGWLRDRLEPAL
jgi:hypothetical protein